MRHAMSLQIKATERVTPMVMQNGTRRWGSRRLAIATTVGFGVTLLAVSTVLSVAGDVGRSGRTGARAVAATAPVTISAAAALAATPCPLDAPGSRAVQPDALVIGRDADHRLCAGVEAHWSALYLHTGLTYTIQTRQLGPNSDTQLSIYDPAGTTVLATDDDGGSEAGASRIIVTATTSGTYLVLVSRAKAVGSDHDMGFELRAT